MRLEINNELHAPKTQINHNVDKQIKYNNELTDSKTQSTVSKLCKCHQYPILKLWFIKKNEKIVEL